MPYTQPVISGELVHDLELIADDALNMLPVSGRENEGREFPVAAIAAIAMPDGIKRLGSGVSTDSVSDSTDDHAEMHALREANKQPGNFKANILVVTFESCIPCQNGVAHKHALGSDGIVAHVTSRQDAEENGQVNPRESIHSRIAKGHLAINSVHLLHPRLQTKGRIVLEHTERDSVSKKTVFHWEPLEREFKAIDRLYSLD